MKVAKFGGTSLADANQIKKVVEIVKSDPERRCVVVSAPGKRNPNDDKITDMLYLWARSPNSEKLIFEKTIISRYQGIIDILGVNMDFRSHFEDAKKSFGEIAGKNKEDYIASRGEYWMAMIMANILDYDFVDAKKFIVFDNCGLFNLPRTEKLAAKMSLRQTAKKKGIVVPGFYGRMSDGTIKTFSRGGSDITGAIIAACVGASLYENFTDVSGIFMADPRIIKNPRRIEKLTYRELRELAYMGANVLHDESIFPVRRLKIPINIRNTNRPGDKGTMVVAKINEQERIPGSIIGIAGKKGFSVVKIEKNSMDYEIGFLRRVCQIMEDHHINIEHIPSGIDTLSVVAENSKFNAVSDAIIKELKKKCNPDAISVEAEMALVCIVGSAMANTPGVSAKIFGAVAGAGVNVKMINQGSSEISIIIGVNEKDYETTIYAIYDEFAD